MKNIRFEYNLIKIIYYKLRMKSNFKISILIVLTGFFHINKSFCQLKTGADQMIQYLHYLQNKKVALVVNQTSNIGNVHLLDTLLKLKVKVKTVFAPEHGFRGNHSAGEKVASTIDKKTGIPIVSLYGKNKKPFASQLKNIDLLIFDIQDVGARFYTYISTLHYVMEACAENNKTLLILDRPNPNGFYVDGPILDTAFRSFVGMHPIPIVHGMTIAEYAQMINGEAWLANGIQCKVIVIKNYFYSHETKYTPPVFPSPNLKTIEAIYLYPSLCFFEGTSISLGRGTEKPFECIGKPNSTIGDYKFTPKKILGVAENPPWKDQICNGFSLTNYGKNFASQIPTINLFWLIEFYKNDQEKTKFFNSFFDKLAGSDKLRKQIEQGMNEDEIKKSWESDLLAFKQIRKKYLLYSDYR